MAVANTRPVSKNTDNLVDALPGRHSGYSDQYNLPVGVGRQNLADEGSYFTCVNATLATAIAGHAAPAIADGATKPLLHLYNGSTKNIGIDYVKLVTTDPNDSSTSSDFVVYVNQQGASSRSSGGTAITPQNVRSDNPHATGATVYFGAVVAAPTNARKVAQWTVRSVIAVAEDSYTFSFGNGAWLPGFSVSTGTTVADRLVSFPPVVIAPGGEFLFVSIGPSGAADPADYEFEFGYWER